MATIGTWLGRASATLPSCSILEPPEDHWVNCTALAMNKNFLKKTITRGWRYSSVVQQLPGKIKVMSSIPSMKKKTNKITMTRSKSLASSSPSAQQSSSRAPAGWHEAEPLSSLRHSPFPASSERLCSQSLHEFHSAPDALWNGKKNGDVRERENAEQTGSDFNLSQII